MSTGDLPITYVSVDDLQAAIESYTNELHLGYRLDMIKPADNPTEAWLSNKRGLVRLKKRLTDHKSKKGGVARAAPRIDKTSWHPGRAGMEYRDLLAHRQGGQVAVSHIRLTTGGPIPDYVHYHKIEFQMIYCLKGRIKVVYEDQGDPFWLEPGDCVVQPPEIRHRVLECIAGSEVVEVSMPAEHETWADHDLSLPTAAIRPERIFGGQPFIYKRSTSIADLRELLSLRGLGPESDASLAACRALESARSHNSV